MALTNGDDGVSGSPNSDIVDGRLGRDTFVVEGIRSEFDISFVGGLAYLTDKLTGRTDKLANIQAIKFDDTTIDLFSADQSEIAALYKVVLGRDADDAGLIFWTEQSANGMSLADIALALSQSAEFTAPDTEALVHRLYDDLFDRGGDDAGVDYWVEQINGGASFADVATSFIRSAEFPVNADALFARAPLAVATPWSDAATVLFGDIEGDLAGTAVGRNDTFLESGANLVIFGDATGRLLDEARGGNDMIIGGGTVHGGQNWLIGDAAEILDNAWGGDDDLAVNDYSFSGTYTLIGDALFIGGAGHGGNDLLEGVSMPGARNILYGDAVTLGAGATGGNDMLDAGSVGRVSGVTNLLYGDAETLAAGARGGDDILRSGRGDDEMWGDAAVVESGAITGRDIFVFGPENGKDIIHDFQYRQDKIDVSAYGFRDLDEMNGMIKAYGSHGENILIDFGDGNQVIVIGLPHRVHGASDFIFAVDA